MKITFSLIFVCFLLSIKCLSQITTPRYKEVKVGDKVPDYQFINIINYPAKTAKLSDFKGKLVILDFWNTSCVSCIASFPKLMNIQTRFADKIQIILVNHFQDENTVRNLFARRKKLANVDVTLPTVCGDTILTQLFPFSTVPHIVWIDTAGFVKSISHGDAVSVGVIESIIKGRDVYIPEKTNLVLEVNLKEPLFKNVSVPVKSLLTTSTLMKNVDGLPVAYSLEITDSVSYIYANSALEWLYRYAYSNRLDLGGYNLTPVLGSRCDFRIRDQQKYAAMLDGVDQYQNFLIYHLIYHGTVSRQQLQNKMQKDLRDYFAFDVKWQKRQKKCLVLKTLDSSLYKYRSGDYILTITDLELHLNAVTTDQFITWLEDGTKYYHSEYPLINETDFKGLIGGINIVGDIYNYQHLNDQLKEFGLTFALEEREVEILVIRDGDK